MERPLGVFLHEMGHAIAHRYLGDSHYDLQSNYWTNIEDLYQWTRSQYEASSSHVILVPNTNNKMGSGQPYALKTPDEFFAEWVFEYIYYHLTSSDPGDPHYMARSRIMDQFFGRDGLNPAAFSAANLREVYRSTGDNIPVFSSERSIGGDIRLIGTLTGQTKLGGEFMLGIASTSVNSFGVGLDILFGLQGSSVPGTYGPQTLLGGELSFRTPLAPVRIELFGRGGGAINSGAPANGFAEVGGRFAIYPSPQSSAGFHLLLGGGYFLDFGDLDRCTHRFGLGLGFSPH